MRTRRHRAIEKSHWGMWSSSKRKLEEALSGIEHDMKFASLTEAVISEREARSILRKGKL